METTSVSCSLPPSDLILWNILRWVCFSVLNTKTAEGRMWKYGAEIIKSNENQKKAVREEGRRGKIQETQKTINKRTMVSPSLLVIILNVNWFSSSIHQCIRITRICLHYGRHGSLGQEDPLEKGMATHSSILAWRIPGTKEPGRATVHEVAKSRTQLSDYYFNFLPY